ncbi:MAG: trigger factor [Bacteroidales bacterium]|nr:trigger factor [Candidatus Physcousia equi]
MNVKFEKQDAVNGTITVEIEKADYADRVEKALKNMRKKAQLPGFRPGQVPMSLLKKRFGMEVTGDEMNKLIGEKLFGYIREEKLNVLGEPLPSEKQQPIDLESNDVKSFVFDVAIAPEFDATVSDKDAIEYYNIQVTEEMVDQQVQAFQSRMGRQEKVESFQERDMVKGILAQLDAEGNLLEGGVQVEGALMLPNYFKNDDEKKKFEGAQVNDVLIINPSKAYEGNTTELASLLKVTKEAAEELTGDFSFQIEEISRYVPAELNQELFDSIYGEGKVNSVEEMRAAIKENLIEEYKNDSDFKLGIDLRKYLEERVGELTYPESMMKRIMKLNNPDKEFSEEEYQGSIKELTWHLMKEQLSDQFQLKVEQADVLETAKMVTRMQFAQYGMQNVPEEVLTNYANQMLQDKRQAEGLVARTVETKIIAKVKETVKLNEKDVTMEEFNAMFK